MKINYEVTGDKRKALVGAISKELNAQVKYLGMPTAAYEVGSYHIDKTGALTGPDDRELVANLSGLHDYNATSEEYETPMPMAEEVTDDLRLTEREELGLGRARREDYQGENGMQPSDVPELETSDHLTIEMPLEGFTPEKLDNLTKLVNAKAMLLKAALGADELPIQMTDDTLWFPWFSGNIDGAHAQAYATLISLLCKTALEKKRVTAKEKGLEGSPKYAMRCFLLSLGFIGDEYKAARKILLSKLDGNSSWKNGKKEEAASDEVSE